jgi:hypothetical protein
VSQPSGRGPDSRTGANLLWAVAFIAAALVGGLAAADLAHVSTAVAVGCSVGVGLLAAVAAYRGLLDQALPGSERRPGGLPESGPSRAGPVPSRTWSSSGADQRPGPAIDPPAQQGVVRLVQADQGHGAWWEQGVTDAPASQTVPAGGPPRADLSQYLDQALIAQCPNCGSFRVDVDSRTAPWRFGCLECRKSWPWEPGQPWPTINVRPNERRPMSR